MKLFVSQTSPMFREGERGVIFLGLQGDPQGKTKLYFLAKSQVVYLFGESFQTTRQQSLRSASVFEASGAGQEMATALSPLGLLPPRQPLHEIQPLMPGPTPH